MTTRPGRGPCTAWTWTATRFDEIRIDPTTMKLDISDQTFAISTGELMHLGAVKVTSMPLGVAMSCGGGYATANVDVIGTPFKIVDNQFALAGDPNSRMGHAGIGRTSRSWRSGPTATAAGSRRTTRRRIRSTTPATSRSR